MRTLRVASNGVISENYGYELRGTPCGETIESGATIYESNLSARFSKDFILSEAGVEAYVGLPLFNGAQTVGIIAATFNRPIDIGDELLGVFNHYRRRLTGEILTLESGDRAALAIKGTSDGIIDWCLETDQIYVSPRGRELLGYQAREFTAPSSHFLALIHEDDKARFSSALATHFKTGRPLDLTARLRIVGGHHRWFRLRAEAVRSPDGEATRVVGALTDIHDLVEARQQATEASRAKSKFLATMSHEVRTPLNGVLGMSSLLQATELEDSQREMVELIEASGKALLDILNDILDLANVESGRFEIEAGEYNPSDVVRTVAGPYRMKAIEKGLQFHIEVDPCADMTAHGDPMRVRQILSNLLSNAVKFTDKGSVRIRCLARQMDDGNRALVFEVSDTGIGMDGDMIAKAFMPFSQAEAVLQRKCGGTGLGLALAQKLAELMGGSISVESAPGAGAIFTVNLPADARAADIAAE
nr:PAS domain-containing protein [Maricaulis parjimensis]